MNQTRRSRIRIREKDIDKYKRKNIRKTDNYRKMFLEDQTSANKYIAYAYRFTKPLSQIKRQLEEEIEKYLSINQEFLAYLEDVFISIIHKKTFLVFMRKYRESQTFADVVSEPEIKATLNIMEVVSKIVQGLYLLEKIQLSHNNLSVETIQFCHKNVIIDLPIFETIHKEMQQFQVQNLQESQLTIVLKPSNMKKDVRQFLDILIKICVPKKCRKRLLNLQKESNLNLIKEIDEPTVKELLNKVFITREIKEDELNFFFIKYFLKQGKQPTLEQILWQKEMTKIKKEQLPLSVDIMGLNIIANEFNTIPNPITISIKEIPLFKRQIQIQHFILQIYSYKECLIFTIQSKINQIINGVITLSNNQFPHPLRKYFQNIKDLTLWLNQNKGKFNIDQSGILSYTVVNEEEAFMLESRVKLERSHAAIQNNLFPSNCIGYIYEHNSFAGRGFLLNSSSIITSASSFYDRKKKKRRQNLLFTLPTFKANCGQFSYPPEYQTCSDEEAWKYNYGVALYEKTSADRQLFLSLLFNFDEKEFRKTVYPLNFDYLVNGNLLNPSEVKLSRERIQGVGSWVEQGSPLMVSVGSRIGVIGIKNDLKGGMLFTQQNISSLLGLMYQLNINKKQILYSRILNVKYFDYKDKQFPNVDFQINKEFQGNKVVNVERLVQQKHGNIEKIILILEKAGSYPYIYSQQKIKYFQSLLTLYQKEINPFHWKIPYILLQLAEGFKKLNNLSKTQELIKRALDHEQIHGRNSSVLMGQLYFDLGNTYLIQKQYKKAQETFQKSAKLFEAIGSFQELGLCLDNLGSSCRSNHQMKLSCQYYQRALVIKQKHCKESDEIKTQIYLTETLIEFEKFQDAGKYLEKLMITAAKPGQKGLREIVENISTVFMSKMESHENISKETQVLKTKLEGLLDSQFENGLML